MSKLWLGIIVLVALLVGAVGLYVVKNRDSSAIVKATKEKGVALSPISYQGDDFTTFLELTKETGEIVSWQGQVADLKLTGGGAGVVMQLARQYSYTPLIVAHNAKAENTGLLVPLTEQEKIDQLNLISAFIKQYRPAHFGFGIEVNVMAQKNATDFEALASFFNEVVDTVKAASSKTEVFTVWQLEKMKGLNGGLFGGKNDPAAAQWDLLTKFDRADFFGFTTYPGLIYKSPTDIPDDYYTDIANKTAKPIAFTEIGWFSERPAAGWDSSPQEQADFVNRFFELISSLNYRLAIWSFMYDQETAPKPFNRMGLRALDGSPKPAWDVWIRP